MGVINSHIDDLLGCGEKDVLPKMEKYLSIRFRRVKVQKDDVARIGAEVL